MKYKKYASYVTLNLKLVILIASFAQKKCKDSINRAYRKKFYENLEQIKECWSLANLQPLWAKDNLSKGAKHNIDGNIINYKNKKEDFNYVRC